VDIRQGNLSRYNDFIEAYPDIVSAQIERHALGLAQEAHEACKNDTLNQCIERCVTLREGRDRHDEVRQRYLPRLTANDERTCQDFYGPKDTLTKLVRQTRLPDTRIDPTLPQRPNVMPDSAPM
jgi:hypothetical protein